MCVLCPGLPTYPKTFQTTEDRQNRERIGRFSHVIQAQGFATSDSAASVRQFYLDHLTKDGWYHEPNGTRMFRGSEMAPELCLDVDTYSTDEPAGEITHVLLSMF